MGDMPPGHVPGMPGMPGMPMHQVPQMMPMGQVPAPMGHIPPMPGMAHMPQMPQTGMMPGMYGGPNEPRSRIVYVDVGDEQPSPPDIQTAFCPYGLIEKISVTPSEGRFGVFVTYSSVRAATRVARLQQIMIGGHTRLVHLANRPDPGCSYDRPGLFLWVGMSTRTDIEQDDVGNCFAQFGDVQKVDMHQDGPNNNYAIVTFCTPDTAMAAYNASPCIKDFYVFVEWFHPGEPLGAPAPQLPLPPLPNSGVLLPTPEETRKLIFKYSLSSYVMEEEIVDALKLSHGAPEKIAIGVDGDSKVAHVIFPTQQAAKKVKDDWDTGRLDIPNANNLTIEWSMLPQGSQGQSPVPTLAPSTNICLQYSSKEELDAIGLDTIKRIFETTIGGIESCQTRDKYAFINFKEVNSAIMALERLPALNIPGAPTAKYARKAAGTSQSTTDVPQMPTIGSSAVSAVSTVTAQNEAFGGPPPANLPPKNSKPPLDRNIQDLVDKLAEDAAAGRPVPDVELVMRTENAGYYRYKADWVKLGVAVRTFEALARMRKAAEACKRQEELLNQDQRPEHLSEYKNEGQIPYTPDQQILILAEKNLSFAAALVKRLGTGSNLVVTTVLPKDELMEKYPEAAERAKELVDAGAKIGYGFNVTKSEEYSELPIPESLFDSIILNYPVAHEGGADLQSTDENQKYLRKILKYSLTVLTSKGRVYITQCDGTGYANWQTSRAGLRADGGLRLINRFVYRGNEYPGVAHVYATFDPPAKYRNSTCYVFGRKKKYDAFDPVEEREVELERIKEKRRKRNDSSDSSDKKRRKKKRGESDDDEPLKIEQRPDSHRDRDRDRDRDRERRRRR
eukprot:TRINITY_DN11755_c0_g1_i1.p1 TRINITY_DN11755_c0_g1~~TRINITY_DN11755_c0_g1_i1.p1  ORF type:complete len:858 (+),score=292.04 TRINITY_DN11755_c0_g1_i1:42-2576(+)